MRRGEIWWANLPKTKRHPVVVLTRNSAVDVREFVSVAPVTSRIRKIPVEIPVGREVWLSKPSVINVDLIQTLPKSDLTARIGILPPDKIRELNQALVFALDIDL